jgi:mercuric ion transport protein
VVTLPEDAKPGDSVECCGQPYQLTFAYGAFAAEAQKEDTMWRRDRWLALGIVGTALTCLACLTPIVALVLGSVGLGAWTGRLDLALVPLPLGFVGLVVYRAWAMRKGAP